MKIHELQDLLCNGNNPYVDISDLNRVLLHYVEEVGELIRAVRKGTQEQINQELGDNLIMLCFVAGSLFRNLEQCTLDKIDKNIKDGKFSFQLPKNNQTPFMDGEER